jgi:transposase
MVEREVAVIKLGEIVMISDLHRQGLSVSAIAIQTNVDRKTIRNYIEWGLEALAYRPRKSRATVIDPFTAICVNALLPILA